MRIQKRSIVYAAILFIGLTVIVPILSPKISCAYGQAGNSISGQVFGLERQPLDNVTVELLDDLNRTVSRTRTNGSGHYTFYRLPLGQFRVRVMPMGTDYEEQEQEVEIVNFARQTSGGTRTSGAVNEQRDFYLKLRKGVTGTTGAVFAQEVPEQAKKLYEKALEDLNNKNEKEGLQGLRSALEAFPNYYMALERLGTEYVRRGSSEKKYFGAARVLLTKAVTVNPRGYRSWYGLAYSLYSLELADDALQAAQKAVEVNPNAAEALLLSGVLLRQAQRFDEAEKHLVKARNLAKDTIPIIYWHLALLYGHDLKRYDEAAKELKLFLKAEPDAKDAEKIKLLIKEFEEKAKGK